LYGPAVDPKLARSCQEVPARRFDPEILGGTPAFVGTRVPVRILFEHLEAGHVQDAAATTTKALTGAAPGIKNIVDDASAWLREWLPVAAQLLGAPPPSAMDEELARHKLGDMLVYIFNEQSGASNRKAKTALAWQPSIPSWRLGFRDLYAPA
jgi:nucleoside-diphosphate-sugar epimerase